MTGNKIAYRDLENAIGAFVRTVVRDMFVSTVTENAASRKNPQPHLTEIDNEVILPRKKRRYKRRKLI